MLDACGSVQFVRARLKLANNAEVKFREPNLALGL